jgi:hypothetical protein
VTKDDIIRMAQKAGVPMQYSFVGDATHWNFDQWLERFAALVAAAEREECAKVCDVLADKHTFEGGYANECAIAIRERGAP